jgi:hypothetical protein
MGGVALDGQYHDPLSDASDGRPNGANYGKDQIRVIAGTLNTAALSCVLQNPQVEAKGCVGRERGVTPA